MLATVVIIFTIIVRPSSRSSAIRQSNLNHNSFCRPFFARFGSGRFLNCIRLLFVLLCFSGIHWCFCLLSTNGVWVTFTRLPIISLHFQSSFAFVSHYPSILISFCVTFLIRSIQAEQEKKSTSRHMNTFWMARLIKLIALNGLCVRSGCSNRLFFVSQSSSFILFWLWLDHIKKIKKKISDTVQKPCCTFFCFFFFGFSYTHTDISIERFD